MDYFLKLLDNLLIEINDSINEKIISINYLETIKFSLIEKLSELEENILEDFKSELSVNKLFSKELDLNTRSINYSINFIGNSTSNIKQIIQKNTLYIVLDGAKIISVFDKNKKNISVKINMTKNKGIVLSQNTIINENINKKSIILTIIYN